MTNELIRNLPKENVKFILPIEKNNFFINDKNLIGDERLKEIFNFLENGNLNIIHNDSRVNSEEEGKYNELKKHFSELSKQIIGQDNALKALIVAITNYLENDENRSPILVTGPTGSGKTYTVKKVCEQLGVTFEKIALPSLTPTGYKGSNIQEIIKTAIETATEKNRKNGLSDNRIVIQIDEFDKIIGNGKEDWFSKSKQDELLGLLEKDSVLTTGSGNKPIKVLFILSGSFGNMAYNPEVGPSDTDLRTAGMKDELIGRLSLRVTINALTKADYLKIIDSSEVLELLKNAEKELNKTIVLSDKSKEFLVQQAYDSGLGARALVADIQKTLIMLKSAVIFDERNKEKLSITEKEIIINPEFLPIRPSTTISPVERKPPTIEEYRGLVNKHYANLLGVIKGQDDAVQKLLLSYIKFVLNPELRSPILVTGPTGSGKTYTINQVASELNIPVARINATEVTSAGFKGKNIQDALVEAINEAEKKIARTARELRGKTAAFLNETGGHMPIVIQIDEFDKLSSGINRETGGAFGESIQRELLGLLEKDATLNGKKLNALFVCSGAYSFAQYDPYIGITDEQLINVGMISEIVGRMTTRVLINALGYEDFMRMLKEGTPDISNRISNVEKSLRTKIIFNEAAMEVLAQEAQSSGLGARALISSVGATLSDIEQKVVFTNSINPSNDGIIITPEFIKRRPKIIEPKKAQIGFR